MYDTAYDNILIKKTEAEKFFSVSQSQLSKWIRQGDIKHMRGYVNMYELFIFWKQNIHGVEQIEANKTEEDTTALAEIKRKIQIEILEAKKIENKKSRAQLVEKKDVIEGWVNRLADLKGGLLNLKSRIKHKAANKTEQEVGDIVQKEVDEMFKHFSREGKFCENLD